MPETKNVADSIPSGTTIAVDPPGSGAHPKATISIIANKPLLRVINRFIDTP